MLIYLFTVSVCLKLQAAASGEKKVSKMGSSPQKRVFLVSNTVFEGTQGKPSS